MKDLHIFNPFIRLMIGLTWGNNVVDWWRWSQPGGSRCQHLDGSKLGNLSDYYPGISAYLPASGYEPVSDAAADVYGVWG